MKELEELEQEELDTQLLDVNPPIADTLPSVPNSQLPASKSKSKGKYVLEFVILAQ